MTVQERITGRRIGVIGMGRSGIAAALLATRYDADVFVTDSKPSEAVSAQIKILASNKIAFETGGHTDHILNSDYVIISPGVPPGCDLVKQLEERGIPIFSEIEFASWICQGRIVAVTGSNGKTTTTTLLGEIFNAAGYDTFVCGNIGRPFAEVADHVSSEAVAVVEVSTFQLERIDQFCPDIALILNLSPDHLDRHGTFDVYKGLKYRIAENQQSDNHLVVNMDDSNLVADKIDTDARRHFFTVGDDDSAAAFVRDEWLFVNTEGTPARVIHTDNIGIPGPHNLQNCSAACVAASLAGVKPNHLNDALRKFQGVEHRLEKVDRVAGIDFINDSKATNVDAVWYALKSVKTPLYLIGGGRDKGGDFKELIEAGRGKIKGLILIGEARQIMFDVLGQEFNTHFADSLQAAVRKAFELALPGETVLLSPGCASFDMFSNYEQRGQVFKETVAGLRNGKTNGIVNG